MVIGFLSMVICLPERRPLGGAFGFLREGDVTHCAAPDEGKIVQINEMRLWTLKGRHPQTTATVTLTRKRQ